MQVNIGQKIRELRLRDNRTQIDVAEKLGVSPQAVSRWEMGATYPDLELLPSLANCFGVTIDNLFGYQSEREAKISAILAQANELAKYDNGVDINIEKRLTLLRNGLAEFPGNEKIMYELAAALSNAGWVRIGEHIHYNDEGYLVHTVDTNRANEYWSESVRLFETILDTAKDPAILNDSAYSLTLLYCNLGEYEKGLALAERMPPLSYSRELMRAYATDGEEYNRYYGKALLRLAGEFAHAVVYTLMSKQANFDNDLPVRMLEGAIRTVEMLFEDGNMGPYHALVSDLLLYLSEHQWRCGMHDEAFASLDQALEHARIRDALNRSEDMDMTYTTPLLAGISMEKERWCPGDMAPDLSRHWPMWMKPDFDDIYAEMSADPRWEDWVRRTKE